MKNMKGVEGMKIRNKRIKEEKQTNRRRFLSLKIRDNSLMKIIGILLFMTTAIFGLWYLVGLMLIMDIIKPTVTLELLGVYIGTSVTIIIVGGIIAYLNISRDLSNLKDGQRDIAQTQGLHFDYNVEKHEEV